MFDRDMRGQLVMVGWPYFEGTMRKDGRSMMLMEGSIVDCLWTYIRSKRFGEDFSFGWPKDLIVAETQATKETGGSVDNYRASFPFVLTIFTASFVGKYPAFQKGEDEYGEHYFGNA